MKGEMNDEADSQLICVLICNQTVSESPLKCREE
jgi:hypothetical protein